MAHLEVLKLEIREDKVTKLK